MTSENGPRSPKRETVTYQPPSNLLLSSCRCRPLTSCGVFQSVGSNSNRDVSYATSMAVGRHQTSDRTCVYLNLILEDGGTLQAGRRIASSFHHTPDFVTVFQFQVVNANVRDWNHGSPTVLTHTPSASSGL